jgi:hypothetical protein
MLMATTCTLAQRTALRAFRAGQYVLLVAEGDVPSPGYRVDIVEDPRRIFPQQFDLRQCLAPGIWPQVVTPYRYSEAVPFPPDQPVVTVYHAEGADGITIEECGPELAGFTQAITGSTDRACPPGADEATGFSKNLSFDEAFANAIDNLPPLQSPGADALERVRVLEIGGLFGGIAGFRDLFVRVGRTVD